MPHPLASGGVVANRFQVGRVLTVRGQHQLTFLAQDRQSNQYVVLKELRDDLRTTPEAKQEFQEELQSLSMMAVPGIPRVRGMVPHEGRQYLIQEFVQGKTLRSMTQKQRLPVDQAMPVLRACLQVLEGLHNQFPPVVHMDVTPDNILLAGWDKAFLVDGSWLKALSNPYPHRGLLYALDYAAPEVIHHQPGPASDLFSLGITIVEAVTGTPAANLYDAGTGRHTWPPLPHPVLQETLARMVEPSLAMRFSSASQVLQALAGGAPMPPFGAQQGGFPPQPQPGFPQQQAGYPPQQPGYPAPQPGYPPQQPQGYPPQQAGYPPQQPGYPPQPNGFAPQQPQGYPGQPAPQGYPPQPGYPPQQPGFPPQPGYGQPEPQQPPAAPPQQPVQPPAPTYQAPKLTNAPAEPPPPPPKPPEPPKAEPPPRRDPPKIVDNIEDVSTEEGLDALMALYEAQNS